MGNVSKFEMMAARYDTEERLAIATVIANELRRKIQPHSFKTALDFGCGTGLVGLQLKDLFEEMVFTDPSPAMIEQVDKKVTEQNIDNITTLAIDLLSDTPENIQVDCIYMSQVLLHIADTKAVFDTLKSLIKPNGRLMIVDFDEATTVTSTEIHPGFSHKELTALAEAAGYSDIHIETFYHGKNLLMNQDASLFIFEATV